MTSINPPLRTHLTSPSPLWERWQQELPSRLAACESRWGLTVTERVAHRVSSSIFRVKVRGRDAVLKLTAPGPHLSQQADVLQAARGEGYVHLYDRDDELGALLEESLGESIEARGVGLYAALPPQAILTLLQQSELVAPLVETIKVAWQLPHELAAVPNEATHKAAQLGRLIDALAGGESAVAHQEAIERARVYAGQRLSARGDSLLVVCHGDPHPGNLLQVLSPRPGAPSGYVWVDPDGFLCEPEYDLGVVLRGFNSLLLAAPDPVVTLRGWCASLADLTDTDAEAIWQWAFIERVTTGLHLIDQGRPDRGQHFLRGASWLIARKS